MDHWSIKNGTPAIQNQNLLCPSGRKSEIRRCKSSPAGLKERESSRQESQNTSKSVRSWRGPGWGWLKSWDPVGLIYLSIIANKLFLDHGLSNRIHTIPYHTIPLFPGDHPTLDLSPTLTKRHVTRRILLQRWRGFEYHLPPPGFITSCLLPISTLATGTTSTSQVVSILILYSNLDNRYPNPTKRCRTKTLYRRIKVRPSQIQLL